LSQPSIFYKKGDVVNAPFPYHEDPSTEKDRPVVLLAPTKHGFICAFIGSKPQPSGKEIIPINKKDFKEGHLDVYTPSYIHVYSLFTVDSKVIREKKGTLNDEVVDTIVKTLTELLQQPPMQQPTSKTFERPRKREF